VSLLYYIIRRIIYMSVVMLLFATLSFFLFMYIPQQVLGLGISFFVPPSRAGENVTLLYQNVAQQFGFGQPWPIRYEKYIINVFTGNYGVGITSISGHKPVWQLISTYAPNSVVLVGVSSIVAIILGALFGVVSAAKRGRFTDLTSISLGVFSFSLPSFWIGLLFLYFFAVANPWFPVGLGLATSGSGGTPIPVGSLEYIKAYLWAATLPIAVLTLISWGGFLLIMRNTVNDVLTEDFIMMARAKGLSERTVLYKHAFRNALLPLVTSVALTFGFILSGAVITESIFSFTGLGWASLQYIYAFDYPVIMGLFFLIGVMVIVANFIADIAYGFLDPRVTY
jgi:peptide/nickel transport system permease protein